MIKIGELSSLTNTPIKTIRFYEEMEIFSPVEVDRWTGYRYYDDTSINRLSEIAYLKGLGFSLKEIGEMSEYTIAKKLKELEVKQTKIKSSISELSELKIGGIENMKNFVNDPQVIGKWRLLGFADSEQKAKEGTLKQNENFAFTEIYFLPNGEEYWTLSWTKGKLFIANKPNKYEIVANKLILHFVDKYSGVVENFAVYEKVDSNKYAVEEIQIKDNTNLPFILDKRVIGAWEAVDFIDKIEDFDAKKKFNCDSALKSEILYKDGTRLRLWKNGHVHINLNWTKDYLINKEWGTVSEYKIVEADDELFMIVEWKSGDYVYGGRVNGYYVFKKIK